MLTVDRPETMKMAEVAESQVGRADVDAASVDAAAAEVSESLAAAGASIRDVVSNTAEDIGDTLAVLIRERPLLAVGVAAGLAYLLGRLRS
jgi:ElaB/YqjD/DUF883 family membrane-anchored ribosome-binding protein